MVIFGGAAMDLTRREFERLMVGAGIAVSPLGKETGSSEAGVGLARYVDSVPRLPIAMPRESVRPDVDFYELTMRQRPWRFHRDLPATQAWGFWASNPSGAARPTGLGYLGPTLIAHRDRPVVVRYRNRLPTTHLLQSAIDVTLWKNVPGIPPDPPGGRMPQDFPAGMNVRVVPICTADSITQRLTAPRRRGSPRTAYTARTTPPWTGPDPMRPSTPTPATSRRPCCGTTTTRWRSPG
ncbi:hypothetical protein Acor_56300 [Acrocarpospora corrugata]|uniref:Uncharacterized protein n=1 Tax=Acrocarpospora corrugata TaxID=35763 RepID=A0A5M3W449_9ACTN|nr:hypothetical protein Acor_56300 [Acrocarpospora corrugata]